MSAFSNFYLCFLIRVFVKTRYSKP